MLLRSLTTAVLQPAPSSTAVCSEPSNLSSIWRFRISTKSPFGGAAHSRQLDVDLIISGSMYKCRVTLAGAPVGRACHIGGLKSFGPISPIFTYASHQCEATDTIKRTKPPKFSLVLLLEWMKHQDALTKLWIAGARWPCSWDASWHGPLRTRDLGSKDASFTKSHNTAVQSSQSSLTGAGGLLAVRTR